MISTLGQVVNKLRISGAKTNDQNLENRYFSKSYESMLLSFLFYKISRTMIITWYTVSCSEIPVKHSHPFMK